MNKMIRLVSVDDHKIFYEGLQAIISRENGMTLLQGYQEGKDIADTVLAHKPDIVLLDVYLSDQSGVAIAHKLKGLSPAIKIVVLSLEVSAELRSKFQEIGVEAYISKGVGSEELIQTIRKVQLGENVYDEDCFEHQSLLNVLGKEHGLTKRELEIYEYMRQGKSNNEIASLLDRSVMTIMTHRKNIKQKLRATADIDELGPADGLVED